MNSTIAIAKSCGSLPQKLGRMCTLSISGKENILAFRIACIEDFILHFPSSEIRIEATNLLKEIK